MILTKIDIAQSKVQLDVNVYIVISFRNMSSKVSNSDRWCTRKSESWSKRVIIKRRNKKKRRANSRHLASLER